MQAMYRSLSGRPMVHGWDEIEANGRPQDVSVRTPTTGGTEPLMKG